MNLREDYNLLNLLSCTAEPPDFWIHLQFHNAAHKSSPQLPPDLPSQRRNQWQM